MAAKTFTIKSGDRLPALATQLLDEDGNVIDLTLCTSAKVVVASGVAYRRIVDEKEARILEPKTDGRIEYDWGSGETSKAGEYLLEVVLTIGGLRRTVPGGWYDKVVILPCL